MNSRNGLLTAGGHRVHKVSKKARADEAAKPRPPSEVPAIEVYMEMVARHMHRVATLPIEDRYLSGCTCGWAVLSAPNTPEEEARMAGVSHAIAEARKLQQMLEGSGEATADQPPAPRPKPSRRGAARAT